MTAKILDGKALAKSFREKIKLHIQKEKLSPGLAVVLVGDNPASHTYVSNKHKACAEVGIYSHLHILPTNTSQKELHNLIQTLNNDSSVHGILLQLPLPAHIHTKEMLLAIAPHKDVDGFHPYNLGSLAQNHPTLRPCTPYGIMELLKAYDISIHGKEAVIIGSSNIVGRPMALEMLNAGATTTVCHRATQNLADHARKADILISATGQIHLVKGDWIKPGAVVIDVGINHLPDGKITGDVDFEAASQRASWITPVPGGVGPMTVAMLLQNTMTACLASRIDTSEQ